MSIQPVLPAPYVKSQRYNVSFKPDLVARMDAAAKRFNITRSALLQFCFEFTDAEMALSVTSSDSSKTSGDDAE